MSITSEQWQEIEEKLKGIYPCVKFNFGEFQLTIARVKVSESTFHLGVYINGEIKAAWFSEKNDRPVCIPDVWRKRTKAIYSAKTIKEIEKAFGKRESKKYYPDLHKKYVYYDCCFTTAKSLVRQFKKLSNLTLLETE
ncbi:hypothetical protein [Pseudoalteromonas 'SMAR']|uniref:hypothetical protein n=1 Tax=Pseudoalteromonas 'SMAR' TaxID=3416908 RepID=UPI003AF24709